MNSDNTPYEKIGDEVIPLEVPFDIPDTWEWIRFKDLVEYSMGKTPPRKEIEYWSNGDLPWVTIADLVADGTVTSTKECVNNYAAERTFKGKISKAGTLLMSFKLTVGKVSILGIDAFHNEAIISIYPFVDPGKIITVFLFAVLPLLSQNGDTKTAIKGNTLNSDSLDALLIPLPPIMEQRRICEKLHELTMPLINYDETEKKATELNASFPEQLKKSILQQAVQGKLVSQDPSDEPAEALLERIRAEKRRLIKEGKIKKDKHESVIFRRDNSHYEMVNGVERCIDDEIPFEVPESWQWVRLNHIALSSLGKTLDKAKNTGDFKSYLCSINVYWDRIDLSKIKEARFENSELDKYKLMPNDLLICEGGDVGRCFVWNRYEEMYYQNALHRVRFYDDSNPYFFKYTIEYYKGIGIIEAHSKGVTIKHLVQAELQSLFFPLPPLAEQHRIVQRIEELLPLIKGL